MAGNACSGHDQLIGFGACGPQVSQTSGSMRAERLVDEC